MAVDSPRWRGYGVTRVGASHTNAGRPGQDALTIVPPPGVAGDIGFTAVAVADGHGHPRHFRSGRGSQLAVEVATEIVRDAVQAVRDATDPAEVAAIWRTMAGPDLLSTWLDAVAQDVDAAPITIQEQVVGGLGPDADFDEIVYAYGATLIVAVVAGPWLLTAQIGDGDLFAIGPDGRIARLFPADPRLDGSRTTSLCQPDAVDSLRFGVNELSGGGIAAVMLATDGYGNAQARDDWDVAFGYDIAGLAEAHGVAWISEQLPRWAERCASSDGSGDDVTLAMLFAPDTRWHAAPSRAASPPPAPIRHRGAPEDRTVPMAAAGVPFSAPTVPVSSTDLTTPMGTTVPAAAPPATVEPTVPMSKPQPKPNDEPTARDLGGRRNRPASPPAEPAPRRSRSMFLLVSGLVLIALVAGAIVAYILVG